MLTYLATYRLVPDGEEGAGAALPATVTAVIADVGLQHAAARAAWRIPAIAMEEGWHSDRTELVAVERLGGEVVATVDAPGVDLARVRRAAALARRLSGCEDSARQLLRAACVVAGVGPRRRGWEFGDMPCGSA